MRGGRGRQRQPTHPRPIIKKRTNMSTSTSTGSSIRGGGGSAVGDCAYSVAQSTASRFSTGFKAQVEWLFSSASAVPNHHQLLSEDEWNQKEEIIRATLAGDDEDGTVDLWKLRELALSPGGLLTPFLRRQAWPKLMACHEQVLAAANNSLPIANLVIPTSEDMRALKHDVSKTIWSVEQHLIASREQEKVVEEKMRHFLEIQRQRSTRVRFAPETRDIVNEGDSTVPPAISRIESTESQSPTAADGGVGMCSHMTIPETIETVPLKAKVLASAIEGAIAGTEGEVLIGTTGDVDSLLSIDEESLGGYCPSETTLSTNFTLSSRVVRWRKATIAEQKILYNVILSVLRTEAEPSEYFEDDRYHYFPGLQDLTAILMINLESPSLTSLVLAKLAGSHLRDAMRKDRIMIDTALAHAFMPLLESVDSELFLHLQRHGMNLPTFCRQWVACWFSQDVPDVDVASRLLDAFLAGHPLLPLYASVALLTSQRAQILQCKSHLSTLYALLRGLPVQNLYEEDSRMFKAESVIATAVDYMRKTTPEALVKLIYAKSNASLVLDTIAMFQAPPAWCYASKAPSDYELLKRAQELRECSGFEETKHAEGEPDLLTTFVGIVTLPNPIHYPLSFAAMGCFNQSKPSSKRPIVIGVLSVIILIVGYLGLVRTNHFAFLPNVKDTTPLIVNFGNLSARFRAMPLKEAASGRNTFKGTRERSKASAPQTSPKTSSSSSTLLSSSISVNSKVAVRLVEPAQKHTEAGSDSSPNAVHARTWLSALVRAVEGAAFSVSLYPNPAELANSVVNRSR